MNLKTIGALLAGSILVHAAVTACSSDSDSGTLRRAHADDSSTEPQVSPATCNATFEVPGGADAGPTTVPYSEQAYPGKTKNEIAAHVSHWTTIDNSDPLTPASYHGGLRLQSNVIVRDGFAGAACTQGKTNYFVWRP
jgi:hypothetical protein